MRNRSLIRQALSVIPGLPRNNRIRLTWVACIVVIVSGAVAFRYPAADASPLGCDSICSNFCPKKVKDYCRDILECGTEGAECDSVGCAIPQSPNKIKCGPKGDPDPHDPIRRR